MYCSLLTADCWLHNTDCWLLTAPYWLLTADCWLLSADWWLLTADCWLLKADSWLLAHLLDSDSSARNPKECLLEASKCLYHNFPGNYRYHSCLEKSHISSFVVKSEISLGFRFYLFFSHFASSNNMTYYKHDRNRLEKFWLHFQILCYHSKIYIVFN